MQAPPVFQMAVRHFGVWRLLRASLTGLAGVVLCAWILSVLAAGAPLPWLGWGASVSALVLSAWGPRAVPVSIRWDGQVWFLGARPGGLSVAIDAGPWLLLRWAALDGSHAWLPVQRRGHEADWHLLRCTLRGARPVADPLAAAVL